MEGKSTLDRWTVILGVILGILTSISSLFGGVRDLFAGLDLPGGLPPKALLLTLGALLILLALLIAYRTRAKSTIINPAALRLRGTLVGREKDIGRIVEKCAGNRLVWLKGDSGCGKSALIREGLVPHLKDHPNLLPLVFDYDSEDWDAGPHQALAALLAQLLGSANRSVSTAPIRGLSNALRALKASKGRTPLLVFDQFDDYQQRHLTQFLTGSASTATPANIIQKSRFWHEINDALQKHHAHVLLVTRLDMVSWLDSFRFVPLTDHLLFSVESGSLESLLLELGRGDQPAIAHPQYGWEKLVVKLIQDLQIDRKVLPQRLQTVLWGLPQLKTLTPSDYRRAGGAAALEALFIEDVVAKAHERSKLPRATILSVLEAMVDPASRGKTRRQSLADLLQLCPPPTPTFAARGGTNPNKALQEALEQLKTDEVVREVAEVGGASTQMYQLDHDYLANAVVQAKRRADYWSIVLAERIEASKDAGLHLLRRWQALLTPPEFFGMLWHKLRRGNVIMSGRVAFIVASSLTTLAPIAVVGAAAHFGYSYHQQNLYREQVDHILPFLRADDTGEPTEKFFEAIGRLRTSPDAMRTQLLARILNHEQAATDTLDLLPYIGRALSGTSVRMRDVLIERLQRPLLQESDAGALAREYMLTILGGASSTPASRVLALYFDSPVESAEISIRTTLAALQRADLDETRQFVARLCSESVESYPTFEPTVTTRHPGLQHPNDCHPESTVIAAELSPLRQQLTNTEVFKRGAAARRAWFDDLRKLHGDQLRAETLSLMAESTFWEFPIAEFLNELQIEVPEKSLGFALSRPYGRILQFLYTSANERSEQRQRLTTQLNAAGCEYLRSLWPRLGYEEMLAFIKEPNRFGDKDKCVDTALLIANKARWRSDLVTLPLHRTSLLRFVDAMPDDIRTGVADAVVEKMWQQVFPLQSASPELRYALSSRSLEIMGALLQRDYLKSLLTNAQRTQAWDFAMDLLRTGTRLENLPLIDEVRHGLDIGITEDYEQLMRDNLSEQLRPDMFAGRRAVEPTAVARVVGKLSGTNRKSVLRASLRNLCSGLTTNEVVPFLETWKLVAGDQWSSQPWITIRASLLAYPIAVGEATDFLLDKDEDRPSNVDAPWMFWDDLETFRQAHLEHIGEWDNVKDVCANNGNDPWS